MLTALTLVVLVLAVAAAAWGPGTHLEFEARVFRRRRERLPADVAGLIESERRAYQYGNIAADIVNLKAIGGHYNHCHRWTIVEEMRAHAETDAERAFILGYLSHLAADTIAHNHFVPYHLARFARTQGLGHLYWEMNADRYVPEERWEVVTRLKNDAELGDMDRLVWATVPKRALSKGTNKVIFNHVLLVSEREQWRRGVARLHPLAKLDLTRGFLDLFRDAAVERILLALRPGGIEKLAHIDTNGKDAQKRAVSTRRWLVRLTAGPRRDHEAEERAKTFLEGMQSPPPLAVDAQPHW
ncbi:MAG TPA: zinc dependent phospholipase C family protein [Planctomycetota bacterium]|nr:zinc dependent phospholipase C family protein [Planctomycetota bacterium]